MKINPVMAERVLDQVMKGQPLSQLQICSNSLTVCLKDLTARGAIERPGTRFYQPTDRAEAVLNALRILNEELT